MNRLSDHYESAILEKDVCWSEWMTTRHAIVIDEHGREHDYWTIVRQPFVLVVPYQPTRDALALVRRYRYTLGEWFWEFPQRRIAEESVEAVEATTHDLLIGTLVYSDSDLTIGVIGQFFEAYGFSSHLCHCVLASIRPSAVLVDGNTSDIRWVSRAELTPSITDFGIHDGATLAALAFVEHAVGRPKFGDEGS